jgi:hypothetical protein
MNLPSLVAHISEWLSKKNACVIFQDTVSRVWPIAHPKEAQERDAKIQEWAKSHGWEAKIKDFGVRVTFKKLSEPIPGQRSVPNTPATLPNSRDPNRIPKRAAAKPKLDATKS